MKRSRTGGIMKKEKEPSFFKEMDCFIKPYKKRYILSVILSMIAVFYGHSLSVSDVVVLHKDGKDSAHYVDRFGYKEAPEFLKPENYLKHVEDIVEQNDNNFDGIINNTPNTPTVSELEQKIKAGESISLTELANAVKEENRSTKEPEKKPSIREQLKEAKKQSEQKKHNTKTKHHELEV